MKYETNSIRLVCGVLIVATSLVYCFVTAEAFGTPQAIDTEAEAIGGGIALLIACLGFYTVGMAFRLNNSSTTGVV